MTEQDRTKIKASLINLLENWLSSDELSGIEFPYLGDNFTSALADACLAVISGMVGTEEYLKSNGQIK